MRNNLETCIPLTDLLHEAGFEQRSLQMHALTCQAHSAVGGHGLAHVATTSLNSMNSKINLHVMLLKGGIGECKSGNSIQKPACQNRRFCHEVLWYGECCDCFSPRSSNVRANIYSTSQRSGDAGSDMLLRYTQYGNYHHLSFVHPFV